MKEYIPASAERQEQAVKMRGVFYVLGSGDSRLSGGDEEIRTPGLVSAIHALSQLSYVPTSRFPFTLPRSDPSTSCLSKSRAPKASQEQAGSGSKQENRSIRLIPSMITRIMLWGASSETELHL